jgi:hypothetical protein
MDVRASSLAYSSGTLMRAVGNWQRGCYGTSNILIQRNDIPIYAMPSAQGIDSHSSLSILLPLNQSWTFDRLWLMEDLRHGQRITFFTVEFLEDGGIARACPWLFPCATLGVCGSGGGGPQGGGNAPWAPTVRRVTAFNGTAVGHKRIIKLASNASDEEPAPQTLLSAVRINVSVVTGNTATTDSVVSRLRSIAVFGSNNCATARYGS